MIKNWKIFNDNLIKLLNEQEMLNNAENPEWWSWWKLTNLKEPDFEIDNLSERIEENRQAILYTIDILLSNGLEQDYKEEISDEQMELIFSS